MGTVFTIDTSRLQLRFPRAGDLPALTATWGDPLTAMFMGDFGPRTPLEVSEWLKTVTDARNHPNGADR